LRAAECLESLDDPFSLLKNASGTPFSVPGNASKTPDDALARRQWVAKTPHQTSPAIRAHPNFHLSGEFRQDNG
jgi:hypothetical protein